MKITPIIEEFYFSVENMIKALVNCTMKYRHLIGERKNDKLREIEIPQKDTTQGIDSIESLIALGIEKTKRSTRK